MKKLIVVFLALSLAIWGCKKEEIISGGLTSTFYIAGVSKDTVRVDDTLTIYIDWHNSEITDQLIVEFDNELAKILQIKNDTSLVVIVPSKWKDGITITHPNGSTRFWGQIYKENYPIVTSVEPLIGTAGDLIVINGKEFLASGNVGVRINTMDCEITELTDTIIKCKVPDGCGNGIIRILYGGTNVSCNPDLKVDTENFNYSFVTTPKRKVTKYTLSGINYMLERDGLERVNKRIHLDGDGQPNSRYDTLVYGADGLLEKVYEFFDVNRYNYLVYARNGDGSLIEFTKFNSSDEFVEKYEYHYLNGRIIQIIYYQAENWLRFNNVYSYDGNKAFLTRTFYTTSGEVDFIWEYDIEYDTQNGFLPKIGIPGHQDEADEYPYKFFGSYSYKNFYNEYGELIKVDRYLHCELDIIRNLYEYE